jgi:Glycolipid 2-alpha-mannosyltransferase
MQNFRYFWRIEFVTPLELAFIPVPVHLTTLCRPGVHFYCDVNFDPFAYMHEDNKTYGLLLILCSPAVPT